VKVNGAHLFIPRHPTIGCTTRAHVSTISPAYASPHGVPRRPAQHPSHVGDVVAASSAGPAAWIKYYFENLE